MSDQDKRGKFQAIIRKRAENKAEGSYNKLLNDLRKIDNIEFLYLNDISNSIKYYLSVPAQLFDKNKIIDEMTDKYEEEISKEIYEKITIVPKES